mmetsp:Transcript_18260/g.59063  ORF Transcript_18260/g.59063 Transcript_18260/m.59063 type:complete len:275 (-) Transcript_18260:1302-2126(-)
MPKGFPSSALGDDPLPCATGHPPAPPAFWPVKGQTPAGAARAAGAAGAAAGSVADSSGSSGSPGTDSSATEVMVSRLHTGCLVRFGRSLATSSIDSRLPCGAESALVGKGLSGEELTAASPISFVMCAELPPPTLPSSSREPVSSDCKSDCVSSLPLLWQRRGRKGCKGPPLKPYWWRLGVLLAEAEYVLWRLRLPSCPSCPSQLSSAGETADAPVLAASMSSSTTDPTSSSSPAKAGNPPPLPTCAGSASGRSSGSGAERRRVLQSLSSTRGL